MISFLQGKKTYILAGLGVLVLVLGQFGVIDSASVSAILPYLGFGSILTLRAAV